MKPLLSSLLALLIVHTTASTVYGATVDCVGNEITACADNKQLRNGGECSDYYIVDHFDCRARYCDGAKNKCMPSGKHCEPKNCTSSLIFW